MEKLDMLVQAKRRFISVLESQSLGGGESIDLEEEVVVSGPLSSKEAMGETERDDFPLLRGKEVLMQAVYRGAAGQAFTSSSGSFRGSIEDVLDMPLNESFGRAVLIATMNAVLRSLGLIENTVHCRDEGPRRCASSISEWIREQESDMVGLIGMQPALLEALVGALGRDRVMVSDLAEAGAVRFGLKVMDGMECSEIFDKCPLILITGSALANGTIDDLIEKAGKGRSRVVFFGSTTAGAAYLMGWERWCPCST
jgi:uncharacterized protein (DUF4213/DUF364 family)